MLDKPLQGQTPWLM